MARGLTRAVFQSPVPALPHEELRLKPLSFHDVDDLGFAGAGVRLPPANLPSDYAAATLGPLLELLHLAGNEIVGDPVAGGWIDLNGAAPLVNAIRSGQDSWVCPSTGRLGVMRAVRHGFNRDEQRTSFLMDAKRAARDVAGLPGVSPGQLVGALGELESNIHEHSNHADTGLLAFRAASGIFEFVVADSGIGVLASLQSSVEFSACEDHGKALQMTLTEGTSRFGNEANRGYGFRPLFIGLMNLQGYLRFRSGDHALILDGRSPQLAIARLEQKPQLSGFFASVSITV
jgi:anti-sigma regulatory factor (Ser/Thr protein kinase)